VLKNHISVFSATPSLSTLTSDERTTLSLRTWFGPANAHPIRNLCFWDPVTHTLEAALEIEETRKENDEDFISEVIHKARHAQRAIASFRQCRTSRTKWVIVLLDRQVIGEL
jgi:hypothetical protein